MEVGDKFHVDGKANLTSQAAELQQNLIQLVWGSSNNIVARRPCGTRKHFGKSIAYWR